MTLVNGQPVDLIPRDRKLPELPHEVIVSILDQLRPYRRGYKVINAADLRQCTLVSSSWTSHAQSLLFAHLEIGNSEICALFHKAIRSSPALALHVRRLDLNAPDGWFNSSEDVAPVLAACKHVHSLVLMCAQFDQLARFMPHLSGGQVATINTLWIRGCKFPTPATLQAFILSSTRKVSTLVLQTIQVEIPDGDLDKPLRPPEPVNLPKLWIYHPQFSPLGHRVGETLGLTFGGIGSLTVVVCNSDDLRMTHSLLEGAGHTILDLHIDAVGWGVDDEYGHFMRLLDLNKATVLRSLTFSLFTTSSGHPSQPETHKPWKDWVTPLLATYSVAHTLQEVVIRVHIWPGSERTLDTIHLGKLDGMLTSAAFPALRKLLFVVMTEGEKIEEVHTVTAIVHERMPLLNANGMLWIEYIRPPNGPMP